MADTARMRPFALLLAALAAACASAPTVPDAPAGEAAPPAPRPEAKPKEVYLCRYKLDRYVLPDGELRHQADALPFARIEENVTSNVELTLPHGPAAQGLKVGLGYRGVVVWGHFKPKKPFRVTSHVPLAFGPVLSFRAGASVDWVDGTPDGQLLAEAHAPTSFRPAGPLRTRLRCEDTTIGHVARKPDAEGAPDAGQPPRVDLHEGVDIPVAAEPGGAVEGVLRFEKESWNSSAVVLEERGDALKVRWSSWPARVEGWVQRMHAGKPEELSNVFGGLRGVGGLGSREGRGDPPRVRCQKTVELHVARDGKLTRVGELRKGAAVERLATFDTFTQVGLPELSWVKLEPRASWAVVAGALEACLAEPLPVPPPPPVAR